jgi:tRNA 2-thiouridine synthesizing protein A
MAVEKLELCGLKCPQPILKISTKAPVMKQGDILEAVADCPTFEQDVRTWCQRSGKVLLSVKDMGSGKKAAQIQF